MYGQTRLIQCEGGIIALEADCGEEEASSMERSVSRADTEKRRYSVKCPREASPRRCASDCVVIP